MATAMTYYQQGDVLIKPVRNFVMVPDLKPRPDGVLMHGEVTGHMHRLTDASDGLLYEDGQGKLWLRVGAKGATIQHEEHKPITVPEGDYEIGRVREYSHFDEEARVVRD